jgi:hypothetical protein
MGTVANGLVANDWFIEPFNTYYQLALTPFTDQEILTYAGIVVAPTPTPTPTPSFTPTLTPTTTPIQTGTPTPIPTDSPIPTNTPTPTNIPTPTYTPTPTATATPTSIPSPTPTPTNTPTPTVGITQTPTPTQIPGSARSLQFDGVNDIVKSVNIPLSATFTYEVWVRRTSDSGRFETYLSDASSNYNQAMFTLYVDGGNSDCNGVTDQFAYYQSASGSTQCSGVTAQLNQWFHIAITRDSTGTRRFFVNGTLRNTQTNSPAPTNSNGILTLGRAGDFNGEFFKGLIDEVRISNAAIYTASFTPVISQLSSSPSTILLYHLNEGIGQTVADVSGNNRNGILGSTTAVQSSDPIWSTTSPFN